MNKIRRAEIKKMIKDTSIIKEKLSSILSDETNCYDNMPENLQNSMRGCDSEEAIEYMDEACELLEEAMEKLENI
ncbi:hypothetical protein [Clostridium sp.]|uniref:hypothetical protein n=1 Tax=Clostridium sp. TaxID=1506 RepID=UPI0032167381